MKNHRIPVGCRTHWSATST